MMNAMLAGIIIGTGLGFGAFELGFVSAGRFGPLTLFLGVTGGVAGVLREYNQHLLRNSL